MKSICSKCGMETHASVDNYEKISNHKCGDPESISLRTATDALYKNIILEDGYDSEAFYKDIEKLLKQLTSIDLINDKDVALMELTDAINSYKQYGRTSRG